MKLFRTTLLPTLLCWLALLFALPTLPLPLASAAPLHHATKHRFRHSADYHAGYLAGYRAGYRARRSHRPHHLRAVHDPPGG